jgi:hypothetical protein
VPATNVIAFDLKDTWQAKVLTGAGGHLGAVIMSVLAHNFDEAMPILLEVVFPGFRSITAPFYCSAAKIDKAGRVVADVIGLKGDLFRDSKIFDSEIQMRDTFRGLADRLKLSDTDRTELFKCVQKWVVADRRLDPTFDPKDPDAKRLIH